MGRKYRTRPSGVLLIDKPKGISSATVTNRIRGRFLLNKVGHTGTLDPEAAGLLVVCLNQATKLTPFLMDSRKTYRVEMNLGVVTESHDMEGEILQESEPVTDPEAVRAALESFVGGYEQLPPMFSAKKKDGTPLYKLAREGKSVERDPVPVEIYALTDFSMDGRVASFTVETGKGCYVRTLCHDAGQKLGCGAAMSSLVRVENGGFSLEDAVSLDVALDRKYDGLSEILLPLSSPTIPLPVFTVDEETEDELFYGRPLPRYMAEQITPAMDEQVVGKPVRLQNEEEKLVAVMELLHEPATWAALPEEEPVLKILRGFDPRES